MKRFSILVLLLAFGIFATGIAETEKTRGKIEMSMPNAPAPTTVINFDFIGGAAIEINLASPPKTEINFDHSFFRLFNNITIDFPEIEEYAQMIEGVFIRCYDKDSGDLTKMVNHYQKILKTQKWENLIKVKEQFHVSLLFSDEPGILHGIFISLIDEQNMTFVNIFGKMDFQKIGKLFGKLVKSEPEFLKNLKIEKKFRIEQ